MNHSASWVSVHMREHLGLYGQGQVLTWTPWQGAAHCARPYPGPQLPGAGHRTVTGQLWNHCLLVLSPRMGTQGQVAGAPTNAMLLHECDELSLRQVVGWACLLLQHLHLIHGEGVTLLAGGQALLQGYALPGHDLREAWRDKVPPETLGLLSPGPVQNVPFIYKVRRGAKLGPKVLPGEMTVFPVQVKCSGPILKEMVLWRYLQS